MLDMVRDELSRVHNTLEDMWLDLDLDDNYLASLQGTYNCAESLFDSGKLEAAQYWLHQFWIKLGDSL
jgi:hypothetical protein